MNFLVSIVKILFNFKSLQITGQRLVKLYCEILNTILESFGHANIKIK